MGYLWGIKLILDYLWAYSWQDYLVLLLAFGSLLYCFYLLLTHKIALSTLNKVCLLFFFSITLLLTISFFHNISWNALKPLAAWFSTFCIFLSSSFCLQTEDQRSRFIDISWNFYHILFYANLFYCLIGKGVILWQTQVTLRGFYYYKTDYAMFILQFTIFLRAHYLATKNRTKPFPKAYYCFLLAFNGVLLLFINTRMATIIYCFLIAAIIYEANNFSIQKLFMPYVYPAYAGILGISILLIKYFAIITDLFVQHSDIKIDTSSFESNIELSPNAEITYNVLGYNSDTSFLSAQNTNGRTTAWKLILEYFHKLNPLQKLFGIDLVSVNDVQSYIDGPHNMYLWLLYAAGIVGILIFLIFTILILVKLYRVPSSTNSFTLLLVAFCTASLGITQTILIETQQIWLFFIILSYYLNSLTSVKERISPNDNTVKENN